MNQPCPQCLCSVEIQDGAASHHRKDRKYTELQKREIRQY